MSRGKRKKGEGKVNSILSFRQTWHRCLLVRRLLALALVGVEEPGNWKASSKKESVSRIIHPSRVVAS